MSSVSPWRTPWFWPALAAVLVLWMVAVMVTVQVVRATLDWPHLALDGGDGVGDTYYPDAGGGGYDAQAYDVAVAWDEATQSLSGRATMTAVATQRLGVLHLDLALPVQAVRFNGLPTEFRQRGDDLAVRSHFPMSAGQSFRVTVEYAGQPQAVTGPQGERPGLIEGREVLVLGEPYAAPAWYPSNDHPSDPARMEVRARVPAGLQAISGGNLISRDAADEAEWDTWHWRSDELIGSYQNFLAIGEFDVVERVDDGRPAVYAVSRKLPPRAGQAAMEALLTSPVAVRQLEEVWGPYPYSGLGGVAPVMDLEFAALETQPRPVYEASSLLQDPETLLVHELAHQWFGNSVTLERWDDIFINEAYAAYSEWIVVERQGGQSANVTMRQFYDRSGRGTWSASIDDPGRERLFTNVYTRGPMALQALRNIIGDEAFFALGREWAGEPGTRSVEEWKDRAQSKTSVDLTPYFEAWLSAKTKPEPSRDLGFP